MTHIAVGTIANRVIPEISLKILFMKESIKLTQA
jgi:hypothetical protein